MNQLSYDVLRRRWAGGDAVHLLYVENYVFQEKVALLLEAKYGLLRGEETAEQWQDAAEQCKVLSYWDDVQGPGVRRDVLCRDTRCHNEE